MPIDLHAAIGPVISPSGRADLDRALPCPHAMGNARDTVVGWAGAMNHGNPFTSRQVFFSQEPCKHCFR